MKIRCINEEYSSSFMLKFYLFEEDRSREFLGGVGFLVSF